jgi:hypothetical protein
MLDSSQAVNYDGSTSTERRAGTLMKVTENMTTEAGGALSRLADILTEDGVGIQLSTAEVGDFAKLTVDSTAYPNKSAYLDPDDCDALADMLRAKANELRGGIR